LPVFNVPLDVTTFEVTMGVTLDPTESAVTEFVIPIWRFVAPEGILRGMDKGLYPRIPFVPRRVPPELMAYVDALVCV
jgi:hypothetical protein